MAKIVADYTNYVAPSTTLTLFTGAGKVHSILAFGAALSTVTLYDSLSGSGNVLLLISVSNYSPVIIFYPPHLALKFSTGLTVVTSANATAHIGTEESE